MSQLTMRKLTRRQLQIRLSSYGHGLLWIRQMRIQDFLCQGQRTIIQHSAHLFKVLQQTGVGRSDGRAVFLGNGSGGGEGAPWEERDATKLVGGLEERGWNGQG